MYKLVFFFLFWVNFIDINAQFTIQGLVANKETNAPLIGCSVYNVSKQTGTITNEDGEYKIYANKGDLIQFSFTGMAIVERYIIDSSDIIIEMTYQVKKLKPVTISSEKASRNSVLANPNYDRLQEPQFKEPTRYNAEQMKGNMGALGAVTSPISYLYYSLNKKEGRRLDAIVDIQKLDISNRKYTLDFISSITKVNDQIELKDIKAYCYFPHEQVNYASYYELGIMVKDCYVEYLEYRKLNPIIVQDSIPKLTPEDFK